MIEREVKFDGSLDVIVEKLIAARNRGDRIYCVFNGHVLHSDDVTLDGAYLECTGHTMEEYYRKRKEIIDKMEEERINASEHILDYIERGKKVIDPEKHTEWVGAVITSFNGIYAGEEIINAIEIMEELAASRDINKAISVYRKHSDFWAKEIVTRFSSMGAKFWKALNTEFVEIPPGNTLESTVNEILKCKREGKKVFCDFNGVILKTDTISMDQAFKDVCGMSKEEFDKKQALDRKNALKTDLENQKKSLDMVPELIERGAKYIYPERMDAWEECVMVNATSSFGSFLVDQALEIMEALENGAGKDEILEILREQGHNGATAMKLRDIVLKFSKRGPEFYRETNLSPLTEEEIKRITRIEAQNLALERQAALLKNTNVSFNK